MARCDVCGNETVEGRCPVDGAILAAEAEMLADAVVLDAPAEIAPPAPKKRKKS